jgi:hypothetical protein
LNVLNHFVNYFVNNLEYEKATVWRAGRSLVWEKAAALSMRPPAAVDSATTGKRGAGSDGRNP